MTDDADTSAEVVETWGSDEITDLLSDAISDSFEQDWGSQDGAKAVMGALEHVGLVVVPRTQADETARLREALTPFAIAAVDLDDDHKDNSDIWEAHVGLEITAGDLRRARAALGDPR